MKKHVKTIHLTGNDDASRLKEKLNAVGFYAISGAGEKTVEVYVIEDEEYVEDKVMKITQQIVDKNRGKLAYTQWAFVMRKIFLMGLLVVSVSGCHSLEKLTGWESHVHRSAERPVFLLAGQSNMVRLSQYALDELSRDYVLTHGGPAPEFVPCAVGGTYSPQWLPGGQLFDGCIEAAQGKAISAVLYYQGESDAYWQTTNWGQNFSATVAGFRQHFGNVPVVFAQIAITTDPDFARGWASIQAQQAAVSIEDVKMIRTEDVAALVDTVHLTPESLQRVAARYVAALN